MKPKSIGIIGGAGPLAGVALLEKVLSGAQKAPYYCHKDGDFPKVFLISFPFSEMLAEDMDPNKVKKELSECLKRLRENGSSILAIACNTLHAFLDETDDLSDLVHLQESVKDAIPALEVPMVLCTSTSARFGIHKKFFECQYPETEIQSRVDAIIDQVLKGASNVEAALRLLSVLKEISAKVIILGCTELSLLKDLLSGSDKKIIDPLDITTQKILEKSFHGHDR